MSPFLTTFYFLINYPYCHNPNMYVTIPRSYILFYSCPLFFFYEGAFTFHLVSSFLKVLQPRPSNSTNPIVNSVMLFYFYPVLITEWGH